MKGRNERITENIVRDKLLDLGYRDSDCDTVIEEQKSQIVEVQKMLRNASKTGGNGRGNPEFIITSKMFPDFVIVIECKASIKNHESDQRNKPKYYAVDGGVH